MQLDPYIPGCEDITVLRMAQAANKAGVGPMAAVAGAIAWADIDAMTEAGAIFGRIDNGGGDIALITDREMRIGIHAGDAPLSNRLAFVIPAQDQVLGICTSPATVGPSISFGIADAVTVFAHDVALSDAGVTTICNQLRLESPSVRSLPDPLEVQGTFAIIDGMIIHSGTILSIVAAVVGKQLISAGDRIEPRDLKGI